VEAPAFADVLPIYRDALMRWGDQWKALTTDGDLHLGTYRRDLFEDPAVQARFQAGYGRPLEPPRTWGEYRDIAAFFSGRAPPAPAPPIGTLLAGTLEAYARNGQRIWYLFSHAAAYASHPGYPGAMFFDPDTMVPAIDNPAWVRALEEFLDLRQFGPADASALDSQAVRQRLADGAAAMNIDWADTGVLAGDPRRSRVAGRLGVFPLPGSEAVWNPATGRWDRLAALRSVTFLAFGGWIDVVPAASPIQDQAFRVETLHRELVAQSNLLVTTFESINDGFTVVDEAGRLVAWNLQDLRLYGLSERDVWLGVPLAEILQILDAQGALSRTPLGEGLPLSDLAVTDATGPRQFEIACPDGRLVELRRNPVADGGFATLHMDVTEAGRSRVSSARRRRWGRWGSSPGAWPTTSAIS